MHREELFEKFSERGLDDLLLVSTLLNQQQDPNAVSNLVNVLLISKLIGGGRRMDTVLLTTVLLGMNPQPAQPSGGTTVQSVLPANLLPLLLILGASREDEPEGYRGSWISKEQDRDKDTDRPH